MRVSPEAADSINVLVDSRMLTTSPVSGRACGDLGRVEVSKKGVSNSSEVLSKTFSD